MTRIVERFLQALASVLAAGILAAGLHDVSRAWDVWYYHLPFAARLAGIVGGDAYGLDVANESRFAGFPLLAELAQGLAWRLTGRPEGANLVSMGSLALLVGLLRRTFRVPAYASFLALIAIPLVQIHVTSSYIDLPASCAAAALVLLVVRMYVREDRPTPRDAFGVLALAAVVANMRFQLHPVVAVASLAALARVVPAFVRERRFGALGASALFIPLVGATFLKNAVVHRNPYYPMELRIGGVILAGPDTPYSSSPPTLEHAPRALRFLCSILEVGLPPFSDARRWTIDQWAPSDSPALRMGGFFNAYVVANVAALAVGAWRLGRSRDEAERRRGKVIGASFAVFTLLVANLPQSHELRYYLVWMLVLVSLNAWIWAASTRGASLASVACLPFLGVVLAVTSAGYVYPSGVTFAELVREKVDPAIVHQLEIEQRGCLERRPSTFLYAAPFHGGRYFLREVDPGEACRDGRDVGAR